MTYSKQIVKYSTVFLTVFYNVEVKLVKTKKMSNYHENNIRYHCNSGYSEGIIVSDNGNTVDHVISDAKWQDCRPHHYRHCHLTIILHLHYGNCPFLLSMKQKIAKNGGMNLLIHC